MAVPILLPTAAQNETFGGVTYHIQGELVPALHLELSTTGVYFEHHILLWKDPAVQIELHPLKGAFKRMLAGMPFLLTGARGRAALPSAETVRVMYLLCTCSAAPASMSANTNGSPRPITLNTLFPEYVARPISFSEALGFSSILFPAPPRKAFSGFTVMATSLRSRSRLARLSILSLAAGSTRIALFKCRPCFRSSPQEFSPAPVRSAGIGLPGQEKSRSSPCITTWKAVNDPTSAHFQTTPFYLQLLGSY